MCDIIWGYLFGNEQQIRFILLVLALICAATVAYRKIVLEDALGAHKQSYVCIAIIGLIFLSLSFFTPTKEALIMMKFGKTPIEKLDIPPMAIDFIKKQLLK